MEYDSFVIANFYCLLLIVSYKLGLSLRLSASLRSVSAGGFRLPEGCLSFRLRFSPLIRRDFNTAQMSFKPYLPLEQLHY